MRAAANNKRLIIGVISLLIVALVYSSFPKSYMAFASQASFINPIKCEVQDNPAFIECCRTFTRGPGDIEIHWCTMCDNTNPPSNCGDRYPEPVAQTSPAPSPKGPLGTILPGGEVLRELEQTPPSPPIGGISEQPPLFGRNVGNAPLGGFFGQQPTTATTMVAPPTPILTPEPTPSPTPDQPVPMFGLNQQLTPTPPRLLGQITPEGEIQPPTTSGEGAGVDTQSRTISPTGYCVPFNKITCVPCDPGLPGANCIPQSEWPPASTTGEDIPQAQLPTEEEEEEEEQPPGALPRPPVGGMPPEAQIAPEGDEGTQPQTQDDGAAEE